MSKELTHWKKAFKSDYLSSSDIDDKPINLIIDKVIYKVCITASGKKFCNVAYFKDAGVKPMILNVVNSKTVKKFSGGKQHLEEWINIPITVFVNQNVKFGNDTVEGLRIKEIQPTTMKPELLQTMPAWGKVVESYKVDKTFNKAESVYRITEENKKIIIEQANAN